MKINLKCLLVAISLLVFFASSCSKNSQEPTPTTPETPTPVIPTPVVATITSINVNSGEYNATVIITGTNFSTTLANNVVSFNGKQAVVSAATGTQLTVTVPLNAGTGVITVSVNGNAAVTGPVFTYLEGLKINSADLARGIAGTIVTIAGTGFSNNLNENKVFFNGKPADVTTATSTQITAKVPQGAGSGPISITLNGKSATGPNFDYYLAFTVTTIAGSGNSKFADGTGLAASFAELSNITLDGAGNIYVADGPNNRIRKITQAGVVTTVAGNGIGGMANGDLSTAKLMTPWGIVIDKTGNVFFTESTGLIRKLSTDGVVSSYAGNYQDLNGIAANPAFSSLGEMAMGNDGNIYLADRNNALIRKITSTSVTTFAGSGKGPITDGIGTSAKFNTLSDLAMDVDGNIYVVDRDNGIDQIRKITPAGQSSLFKVTPCEHGIAVDKKGNVYVSSNQGVKIIDQAGNISYAGGITGIRGFVDGNQSVARFDTITDIAVDDAGNLIISELYRVRKITF